MQKTKKVLLFGLSVMLFAFCLLFPFKNIKRDKLNSTYGADVQVQLNAGIYSFNRSSDFVDLPTSIITLNDLDFNYYNATFGAWVNANRMFYNYSSNSLTFGLIDNNTILFSSPIINNGSFVSFGAWTRYFILNEPAQVPLDFYTFINSNTTYQSSNARLCILSIKNLGFDLVTGLKFQLYNVSSSNTNLRYYFSKSNLSSYFSDDSFYFVDSNFTDITINQDTNSYYLSASFTSQVFINDLYIVANNRDYYFKTLANSLMPYLHSYSIIFMDFYIVGQNDIFNSVIFDYNKISYVGSNNSLVLASYSSNSVSSFEWLAYDYNGLAIHITNLVDDSHLNLRFLYNNFVVLSDYELSVIDNKNKALEMLREKYTFYSMFSAMFDSCLIAFKSLFNYSIFGVNLFSFMCALLTLSLIFFVFKLLKGGK